MKKKIIYGLLFAVAMVTASSSFVSCKDYEGDDYAQLKEENLSLRDALNQQIAGMSAYALKTDGCINLACLQILLLSDIR